MVKEGVETDIDTPEMRTVEEAVQKSLKKRDDEEKERQNRRDKHNHI